MTTINLVRDTSEVGEVRRAAAALARDNGLAERIVAHVALVATEMSTNLLKHAGGGVVRFVGVGNIGAVLATEGEARLSGSVLTGAIADALGGEPSEAV
jgi:hypothetical protein